jgi:hypothetical protein
MHGTGEKNVQGILVGKPEGKRPLVKLRCRREDGIKMDLREIGWRREWDSPGSGWWPVEASRECSDEPLGSGATVSQSE